MNDVILEEGVIQDGGITVEEEMIMREIKKWFREERERWKFSGGRFEKYVLQALK